MFHWYFQMIPKSNNVHFHKPLQHCIFQDYTLKGVMRIWSLINCRIIEWFYHIYIIEDRNKVQVPSYTIIDGEKIKMKNLMF